MKKAVWISCAAVSAAAALSFGPSLFANDDFDWGRHLQNELNERSNQLFGTGSLRRSALGPFTDADSTQAIKLAQGLHVSLVSSAVHFSTDQIVLWPNDDHPTHLFVCDESSSNPAVQKVDLSKPAASNATTILTGIVSCDPIRHTPWGSLIAGEEATDGGVYEIMDPMSITAPIAVTNRATGATGDPRVVKRKALGQLAWEGNPVLPDGTIIFADELRPGGGNPGGAIYKFVPAMPYGGSGVITNPALGPHGRIDRRQRSGHRDRSGRLGRHRRDCEHGRKWKHRAAPSAGDAAAHGILPAGRHGHRSDRAVER
jgi:hypothetical protein